MPMFLVTERGPKPAHYNRRFRFRETRLTPPWQTVMVAPLRSSLVPWGNRRMTAIQPILLALGLLLSGADDAAGPSAPDVARLQEMLQDHEHPRGQSQAALLLVQSAAPE